MPPALLLRASDATSGPTAHKWENTGLYRIALALPRSPNPVERSYAPGTSRGSQLNANTQSNILPPHQGHPLNRVCAGVVPWRQPTPSRKSAAQTLRKRTTSGSAARISRGFAAQRKDTIKHSRTTTGSIPHQTMRRCGSLAATYTFKEKRGTNAPQSTTPGSAARTSRGFAAQRKDTIKHSRTTTGSIPQQTMRRCGSLAAIDTFKEKRGTNAPQSTTPGSTARTSRGLTTQCKDTIKHSRTTSGSLTEQTMRRCGSLAAIDTFKEKRGTNAPQTYHLRLRGTHFSGVRSPMQRHNQTFSHHDRVNPTSNYAKVWFLGGNRHLEAKARHKRTTPGWGCVGCKINFCPCPPNAPQGARTIVYCDITVDICARFEGKCLLRVVDRFPQVFPELS